MTTNTPVKYWQLATKQENRASGTPGPKDIFYISTEGNITIPRHDKFVLSGSADGTAHFGVDDLLIISTGPTVTGPWTTLYEHDFSKASRNKITWLPPQDLTGLFKPLQSTTTCIQSTFTDLYHCNRGGSALFLCMYDTPPSGEILGGWSQYRPITLADKKVFDEAMPGSVLHTVDYYPTAVATQVVNGMNYRYKCTAQCPPSEIIWEAIVEIFQASVQHGHPQPKPVVVGIVRI